jgi:hypothetical protein
MTLQEALSIRPGDKLVTKYTGIPLRPVRVTDVWVNARHSIVLVRLDPAAWLDATGYDLPPKGMGWDDFHCEWVDSEELKRRKQGRAS